jgi:hypothetical protein
MPGWNVSSACDYSTFTRRHGHSSQRQNCWRRGRCQERRGQSCSASASADKAVAKLIDAKNTNDSKYRRRLLGDIQGRCLDHRGQSCYRPGYRAKVADDNAVVSLVTAAKVASRRRICGRGSHCGAGNRQRKSLRKRICENLRNASAGATRV